MNSGAAEPVHSGFVHMDVREDLPTSTNEGDDAVDVDDFDFDDPDFRRADWESSLQSESFGSFIDEELRMRNIMYINIMKNLKKSLNKQR